MKSHFFKPKVITTILLLAGGVVIATKLAAVAQSPLSSCALVAGAIADSNTGVCLVEPDSYKVVIHEFGLCKSALSDPTSSTAIDFSNCSTIFKSDQGYEIAVVTGAPTSLPANLITPPPNGTYTHGYVIKSPTFKISGVFNFQNNRTPKYAGSGTGVGNKCWTKTGTIYGYGTPRSDMPFDCGTTAPASSGEITAYVNSFDGSNAAYSYQRTDTDGLLHKAFLLTTDMKLASSAGADTLGSGNTAVAKLIGTAPVAVNVTGESQTIDIAFRKTTGAAIVHDSIVNGVQTLYGIYHGPPSTSLQVK
jgi:hypothetical protein